MKTGSKTLLGIMLGLLTFVVLIAGICFSAYVSNFNYGNGIEKQIQAEYKDAQNVMSSTATTVVDIAKVSEQYAQDVKELVRETMSGRYGEDGSEAVVQWIQEQNIQLEPQMYRDISQAIKAGRQDFRDEQRQLIDLKRSYETKLGSFWSGMWLRVAGYPKIDLDDYKIILDQSTQDKFEKGVDSGFL